jgi:hypothetical protein
MPPLRRRISASTADDDRAGVDGFAAGGRRGRGITAECACVATVID